MRTSWRCCLRLRTALCRVLFQVMLLIGCGDRLLKSVLGASWRSHNHFQHLKLARRVAQYR